MLSNLRRDKGEAPPAQVQHMLGCCHQEKATRLSAARSPIRASEHRSTTQGATGHHIYRWLFKSDEEEDQEGI